MIASQLETHTDTPMAHEWIELADGRYRTICARWTEAVNNLVTAAEVTCGWCLNRIRRRAQNSTHNSR